MAFDKREWQDDENVETIGVNGDEGEIIKEDEVAQLLMTLQ